MFIIKQCDHLITGENMFNVVMYLGRNTKEKKKDLHDGFILTQSVFH